MTIKSLAACIVLVIAGCSAAASNDPHAAKKSAEAAKPIVWNGMTYGLSLEDAVGKIENVEWNAVAMRDCLREMAIKGCLLSPDRDRSYAPLQSGIMFLPTLSFNRQGQLTDVTLIYEHDGKAPSEVCEDIHRRTLDRLVGEYGPPRHDTMNKGEPPQIAKTPAGNEYQIHHVRSGSFIAGIDRFGDPRETVGTVALFTSRLSGEGVEQCRSTIMYTGPKAMLRRD